MTFYKSIIFSYFSRFSLLQIKKNYFVLKMSFKLINKLLLLGGFASLAHAAFSAAHHRTYLRVTEQDWNQLPLDIILQTAISLIVIIYNIIQIVADFKEIRAAVDLQGKSWETLGNLPSFYSFNHRGKALHPSYEPPMGGRNDLMMND